MKKLGVILITSVFTILSISLFHLNDSSLSAASNYKTGDKVYIGNDSYTIIDANAMTLLKDSATDAGEVTWNQAVASLNSLPNKYGELGSKAFSNKFSLPKTTDLTSITNNNSLTTIDPITTDWWLGDAAVDNRSKFVGANTNSLVTDVSLVTNVIDKQNLTCTNETVTEQGVKVANDESKPSRQETFDLDVPNLKIGLKIKS